MHRSPASYRPTCAADDVQRRAAAQRLNIWVEQWGMEWCEAAAHQLLPRLHESPRVLRQLLRFAASRARLPTPAPAHTRSLTKGLAGDSRQDLHHLLANLEGGVQMHVGSLEVYAGCGVVCL